MVPRKIHWVASIIKSHTDQNTGGTGSDGRIRLMLLHPHALFRTSLARLLEAERDIELVGDFGDSGAAAERISETRPDIVLLDFNVWRDFVSAARTSGYTNKFLAVGADVPGSDCIRALSQGISGVVTGSDSPSRLVQAIHAVVNGVAWVDQSVIQLLADRYPYHQDQRLDSLSGREQAVLRGILSGFSNRKIAEHLATSEGTVKTTLQHLFRKTGVRTRSQLVKIMLDGTTSCPIV